MPDDLVFADIAGHIVFDIEAAHEAEKGHDAASSPATPSEDAPEEAALPSE